MPFSTGNVLMYKIQYFQINVSKLQNKNKFLKYVNSLNFLQLPEFASFWKTKTREIKWNAHTCIEVIHLQQKHVYKL